MTLLSQPALAEESSKNPQYQKAFRLYNDFEYEAALVALEKAATWSSNTREDLVSIALLEGVLAIEIQQPERGKNAFRHALSLDPTAKLGFSVSPKITALLEQVRAEFHPPAAAPQPEEGKAQVQQPKEAPPEISPRAEQTPSTKEPPPPATNGLDAQAHGASKLKLPVAIGGGVVALGGLAAWGKAKSIAADIGNANPSITTRQHMDDTLHKGKTFEKVGWILMGLGAATTAGSLLFLDRPRTGPKVTVTPAPEGAYLSTEWSLP